MEILAPAGYIDSVHAAVDCGADSVYLGLKKFSARRNARNFDESMLQEAVSYCHEAGVRVYLTLNTLIFDEEIPEFLETAQIACRAGVDAVIVQDLGAAAILREAAPELRLHASTQMSVHTPRGAQLLERLGFSRVVLAREMSLAQIAEVSRSVSIETEVFIHGALCMCMSGQCYLSAMLGGRSANRGLCAQPCRLPFHSDRGAGHALSLKDLCAVGRIHELEQAGVTSVKIEGRMKRPEYVAVAVDACCRARAGETLDMETLQSVFSRSGFTDSYLDGRTGPEMFGIRDREDVIKADGKLLKRLNAMYHQPLQRVRVAGTATLRRGEPARFVLTDFEGHRAEAEGEVPQEARTCPATLATAYASFSKMGGTHYRLEQENFSAVIDEGVMLPLAALNLLRRQACAELSRQRGAIRPKEYHMVSFPPHRPRIRPALKLRAFFSKYAQIPFNKTNVFEQIILPVEQVLENMEEIGSRKELKERVVLQPPRAMFGCEQAVMEQLKQLAAAGYRKLFAMNLAHVEMGQALGMEIYGGFGLNITNSFALQQLAGLGVKDTVLSIEMKVYQINQIADLIPVGAVIYGHLPLMLMRNCPIRGQGSAGCSDCTAKRTGRLPALTDRKGKKFLVRCEGNGGCTELLNPNALYMADQLDGFEKLGFGLLLFTTENQQKCAEVIESHIRKVEKRSDITRGLFYRGVL
ncbi:MAG TPA: U32 family peptidase [Firmicutes bacterium]|nr:U32 family peptidase [Bacillota bacterium]